MATSTPAELHTRFVKAFNESDLSGLLALYEPHSTFITGPDSTAQGLEALRDVFLGFLAQRLHIDLQTIAVVEGGGDLAFLQGSWRLTGNGPDGDAVERTGISREVARRQGDGTWRYVIDDPGSTG